MGRELRTHFEGSKKDDLGLRYFTGMYGGMLKVHLVVSSVLSRIC